MSQNIPLLSPLQPRAIVAWPRAAAVVLLAIHAFLSVDTLRQKSVTVDEVGHLPAGISYWQKGTFELYHHNPPLGKLLAALPALAADPIVDYSKSWEINRQRGLPQSPWSIGWEFMYANAARYQDIYFWARLSVVALSMLAGVVIFLWAGELFGPMAGLIGLSLWSFCPNAIAHAGMVTTDMAATSLGFVATYSFWLYVRCPTWSRAAVVGVLLGIAQLSKFSLLLYYGIWPTIWICSQIQRRTTKRVGSTLQTMSLPGIQKPGLSAARVRAWRGLGQLVVIVLVSVFVINLGYGFEGTGTNLRKFAFLSSALTRPRDAGAGLPVVSPDHPWYQLLLERQNRFQGTWLGNLPVPLPRHYIEGFDEQKLESEGVHGSGYPVYLCGELRRTGWWWYYFFALAVKVPLGTWVLTLLAIVVATRQAVARASVVDELTLLATPITVLIVMSFLTDINLGLRYVLPIFPFWFVFLSRVARLFEHRRIAVTVAVFLAVGWNAAECVWNHPDHLAYFNELVGGPKQGYRYLIDSNLDWGQDLLNLEAWLRVHRPGQRVGLAYFGNVDPSILAASGRPIHFDLAPPRRFEDLNLVATKGDGPLFQVRMQWIEGNISELDAWLKAEHARGHAVMPNDHPVFRSLAFEQIGLREGPQPGLFAVSANLVAGLPFRLRDQMGNMWSAEQDAYAYFGHLTPLTQVGHSIFVYSVSFEQANSIRSRLGLPPLSSDMEGQGRASTQTRNEESH